MGDLASGGWLRRLVAFDTVSCHSNLGLIQECQGELEKLGFTCQRFYNEERTKCNLLASIGPLDVPGVMLSGHTDVVPVTGQSWSTNPFEIVEKEGLLYGRGTCDMKGFVAVCLSFAPRFAAVDLKRPVFFALSYDEEVGCIGVHSMTEFVSQMAIKPLLCFVGEPTGMEVVRKHKGKQSIKCTVRGHECHSSLVHQGVNAVEFAAELICKMRVSLFSHTREILYLCWHSL
jgi:acetylornithine deacetylase